MPRRNGKHGHYKKAGNNNPDLTENRARARVELAQAQLAAILARKNGSPQTAEATRTRAATADDEESEESEDTASAAEKRMTIKYFYKTECHCAPEEDWSGRDGTIAHIRHRMGSSAPSIHVVRNTLRRLAGGDQDIAASWKGGWVGRAWTFTDVDDLYVGLLLCDGLSQVQVTLMVNAERRELEMPEDFSRYFESVVGDRPEMCALDFHLFEDLDHAVLQNIVRTSRLPKGHKDRYDNGTPKELASAMVRTWADHPQGWRIVEDMTRLPLVLDKIIEAKGGLVPDFEMQHGGCSKRKRSLKGADSASLRSYQPSAEVAAVAKKRCKELRQKASEMCGN